MPNLECETLGKFFERKGGSLGERKNLGKGTSKRSDSKSNQPFAQRGGRGEKSSNAPIVTKEGVSETGGEAVFLFSNSQGVGGGTGGGGGHRARVRRFGGLVNPESFTPRGT